MAQPVVEACAPEIEQQVRAIDWAASTLLDRMISAGVELPAYSPRASEGYYYEIPNPEDAGSLLIPSMWLEITVPLSRDSASPVSVVGSRYLSDGATLKVWERELSVQNSSLLVQEKTLETPTVATRINDTGDLEFAKKLLTDLPELLTVEQQKRRIREYTVTSSRLRKKGFIRKLIGF